MEEMTSRQLVESGDKRLESEDIKGAIEFYTKAVKADPSDDVANIALTASLLKTALMGGNLQQFGRHKEQLKKLTDTAGEGRERGLRNMLMAEIYSGNLKDANLYVSQIEALAEPTAASSSALGISLIMAFHREQSDISYINRGVAHLKRAIGSQAESDRYIINNSVDFLVKIMIDHSYPKEEIAGIIEYFMVRSDDDACRKKILQARLMMYSSAPAAEVASLLNEVTASTQKPDILMEVSGLFVMAGNAKDARNLAKTAADKGGNRAGSYNIIAHSGLVDAKSKADYKKSYKMFRRSLAKDPSPANTGSYVGLAICAANLDRHTEVIELHRKLKEEFGEENSTLDSCLALTFSKIGRFKEAFELYNKILPENNDNLFFHYQLAYTQFRMGGDANVKMSAKHLLNYLRQQQDTEILGVFGYTMGKLSKADRLFYLEELAPIAKEWPEGLAELSRLYARCEKYAKAKEFCEAAEAKGQDCSQLKYHIDLRLNPEDKDLQTKAFKFYNSNFYKSLGAARNVVNALLYGGLNQRQNIGVALFLTKKCLKAIEGYSCFQSLAGRVFEFNGKPKDAFKYYKKAAETDAKEKVCSCGASFLSYAYLTGTGTPQNKPLAAKTLLDYEKDGGQLDHDNSIQLYAYYTCNNYNGFEIAKALKLMLGDDPETLRGTSYLFTLHKLQKFMGSDESAKKSLAKAKEQYELDTQYMQNKMKSFLDNPDKADFIPILNND